MKAFKLVLEFCCWYRVKGIEKSCSSTFRSKLKIQLHDLGFKQTFVARS